MALRPKAGSAEMCLRVYPQWTIKPAGSSEEGEIRFEKFILAASNDPAGTTTSGNPPLGCVEVAFRDLPSNPTLTSGEMAVSPSEEVSVEVSWRSLKADPVPRPWSDE